MRMYVIDEDPGHKILDLMDDDCIVVSVMSLPSKNYGDFVAISMLYRDSYTLIGNNAKSSFADLSDWFNYAPIAVKSNINNFLCHLYKSCHDGYAITIFVVDNFSELSKLFANQLSFVSPTMQEALSSTYIKYYVSDVKDL